MGMTNHPPQWEELQENMQKALGDSFWKDMQNVLPRRIPLIDLFETQSEGFVVIEVPGISKQEDVQLDIKGSKLYIDIHLPYPYPVSKERLHTQERMFGNFKRMITLPFSYEEKSISAHYKNGLLTIRFTKINQNRSIKFQMEE